MIALKNKPLLGYRIFLLALIAIVVGGAPIADAHADEKKTYRIHRKQGSITIIACNNGRWITVRHSTSRKTYVVEEKVGIEKKSLDEAASAGCSES
jgi:hypothetical protein